LELLRDLTLKHGIILIFDEVITGFRLTFGGAQHIYKIQPDMTILGKIIGGGFPVGAFGGKKEIMDLLAPEGNVYQAGTLSGNPVAMAAGTATLEYLSNNRNCYAQMDKIMSEFSEKWRANSKRTINHIGSMFTIFHTDKPVTNFTEARNQNPEEFRNFFIKQLERGVYLPPSMFETAFISTEHTIGNINSIAY
jgi:glutamate-1-semialdehyde 2,1-aminomutase